MGTLDLAEVRTRVDGALMIIERNPDCVRQLLGDMREAA